MTRVMRVLALACLAMLLLAGPALAAGDDDIPGAALALGEHVTGVVDEQTDVSDVFTVSLTSGEQVRLTLSPTAVGVNTQIYVHLLAPASKTIRWGSDHYTELVNEGAYTYSVLGADPAVIDYTPARTGDYHIWVEGSSSNATYDLVVLRTPSEAITMPDTDDIYGVAIGPGMTAGVADEQMDPNDVYAVRLTDGKEALIRVTPQEQDRNSSLQVHLLAPGSTTVRQGEDNYREVASEGAYTWSVLSPEPAQIDYTPARTGVYFLWLEGTNGNVPYSIEVAGTAAKPADAACLTLRASPTKLRAGGKTSLSGTLSTLWAAPLAARPILVQSSANRTKWVTKKTITSAAGLFSVNMKVYRSTYFRLRFPGSAEYTAATSVARLVRVVR